MGRTITIYYALAARFNTICGGSPRSISIHPVLPRFTSPFSAISIRFTTVYNDMTTYYCVFHLDLWRIITIHLGLLRFAAYYYVLQRFTTIRGDLPRIMTVAFSVWFDWLRFTTWYRLY